MRRRLRPSEEVAAGGEERMSQWGVGIRPILNILDVLSRSHIPSMI